MKKRGLFLLLFFLVLIVGSGCNKDAAFIEAEYLFDDKETIADFVDPEWEKIEEFLALIARKEIDTIDKFYLYGSEVGYEKVPATNYGYLSFYTNTDLEIIEEIVPLTNTKIRPGKMRANTKYIVIHNTGMASPVMTASRLSKSINNSTRQASWHFTVDDKEVYQQLLLDEIGWHAGSPEGNNYGIGIEMAVYQGIDLNMAMRRTAKLTAWLMLQYDLGIESVKRHYDFSGKHCPQVLMEAGRWEEFLELVQIEYYGQKYFSDVEFIWESLSAELMDNDGKIFSTSGKSGSVRYRVLVNYQGKLRTFEFVSGLKALI